MKSVDQNAAPTGIPAGDKPQTPVKAKPAKFGIWIWLVIILIIAGLLAGALPRWFHGRGLKKESDELSVSTVEVTQALPGKSSASLFLPAEVRPYIDAPIYARASGFIKKWYKDIGAKVNAGDLLADIDTPELDQQLTGARAELVQSEAALALAKVTAERWAGLLKTSSVSEQENAEKEGDLKLKIASVDAASANVHRLADLQSFTHVTAPFAGTLTTRDIDVGDLISPGKELFRLSDTSKLRVFVRVPQSATPGIAIGVNAEMTVPELPAHIFTAKVVRTAGAIDASSRTLLTELEVDNSKGDLFSGSYAQVSFPDLKQLPALTLPANTLLFRSEGLQVGVVNPNGIVELHKVMQGRDFGKTIEILDGITSNDQVIVNPADSLISGTAVRVASTSTAEKTK